MSTVEYFPGIEPIPCDPSSTCDLAFRVYDPERVVLGRSMAEQLRIAVCYWHTFGHQGADVFGAPTFERAWNVPSSPREAALRKLDAAFEFFEKLGAPFFCFHDRDVAPESGDLRESDQLFRSVAEQMAAKMEQTGVRLLWGTANLFSHPRYAAGAATSPDPEIFACAAAQVRSALEVTHQLGGANYVLWGGREGYDTLLHTDLARERQQLGRFLARVVEHKHAIGFRGQILVEPKPREPTAHQYDYDVAAVVALLEEFDLRDEVRINVEANHATLAGHTFHHEVAAALAHGVFGSIDLNRGDSTCGWDTDQFPIDLVELSLVLAEILQAGGVGQGGFNFDARLRRQSTDAAALFHAHVGGMDLLARALLAAARLLERDVLGEARRRRASAWDSEFGREALGIDLATLADRALGSGGAALPPHGGQELLERRILDVILGDIGD